MTSMRAVAGVCAAVVLVAGLACASGPTARTDAHYLRRIAFEVPINEHVLMRWPDRKMPLRVHLSRPPDGLFEDPEAIYEAVRKGVLGWQDAAGPGLPRFEFVDRMGDADIPIVWAERADDPDWYIAHCAWDIQAFSRRFGVSRILVTARWGDGGVAAVEDIYGAVLHEMGHALGLGGHSPDAGDVMYASISGRVGSGLSARDRETLRLLYERPIGTRVVGARSEY